MKEKKEKGSTKKISGYKFLIRQLDNIAATTKIEYKKKHEKISSEFLLKHGNISGSFNPKDWKYVESSADELRQYEINFEGYSNYQELLEDATFFCQFVARPAYEMDKGRVHRCASRIAIILAVTAAEDFVNLEFNSKGWSLKDSDNKQWVSFKDKWKRLLPDYGDTFGFFNTLISMRDDIIHFKENKVTDSNLQKVVSMNHKTALRGITTVQNMIRQYKSKEKYDTEIFWMAVLISDFIAIMKKLQSKIDKNQSSNGNS